MTCNMRSANMNYANDPLPYTTAARNVGNLDVLKLVRFSMFFFIALRNQSKHYSIPSFIRYLSYPYVMAQTLNVFSDG